MLYAIHLLKTRLPDFHHSDLCNRALQFRFVFRNYICLIMTYGLLRMWILQKCYLRSHTLPPYPSLLGAERKNVMYVFKLRSSMNKIFS